MGAERLIIKDGKVECIYSDALRPILKELGKTNIRRASHVEPDENGQWVADLSPVNGPKLGPYELRETALREEVKWLNENYLGVSR